MLITGLLKLLNVLVVVVLAAFPNWSPPTGSPGFTALSAANIVLPLDTWAMLSGATVAVMASALTIWVVMKAFNAIRGSGA